MVKIKLKVVPQKRTRKEQEKKRIRKIKNKIKK
jgi:hypothetical protein